MTSPANPPADEAEAEAQAAPGPHRRRGSRSSLGSLARPVPLLVLALVASLLWGGWLGLKVRSDNQSDAEGREVVATAETVALSLTTYDHTRLEEDFAAVTQNLTKTFAGDYTVASDAFRKLIAQLHAKATSTILNTGLIRHGGGTAEVMVFVDQTVTNDNMKDPSLQRLRMRLTLEHQGSRWLVSGVFLV